MSTPARRRITVILILFLLLLLLLAGFLMRCSKPVPTASASTPGPATEKIPAAATASEAPPDVEEKLDHASLDVPSEIAAGSMFSVEWTGPANKGDYITVVPKEAADNTYKDYLDVKEGSPLKLTASIEAGDYEVRYVTQRSKTVLGRVAIKVTPVEATLNAAGEATQGTVLSVEWTGPDNKGDYITVVPKDTSDGKYENYSNTSAGSPLNLKMPIETGEMELRYMSGQGAKVLGRRAMKILPAEVTLKAPAQIIAGTEFAVEWIGPGNQGDYVTIVPKEALDGKYGNYANTGGTSPLTLTALITPGEAEIRYMTGQGAKVLARQATKIVAAEIRLEASSEAGAKTPVSITWTGPNNKGDYITIVPKSTPDGQYKAYANTSRGSPLNITAPDSTGEAEIRYMSGQGAQVLKRLAITIR